ncbi:sulfate ABC transporter permease subunit CysT [Cellvibrio japonicus]|nr:sulfate ABC transporter permease subunit CysT [Cellvibrio japonicus]QEI14200.1 sulfate ABC transporter permease subunit CysT [Cellvibrio japonicus]QEI17777.1 sulfate ABC transporter permease subunit CysT [Cellvibrio japonicus]QEI21352.1 sulfate ABC transporter permease subunit CysT [Cellvibrio japonicus]
MLSRPKRVLPGLTLSLGLSVFYLSLIVLLPAITLILKAAEISWNELVFYFTDPRLLASFKVTFLTAAVATFFNGVLGLLLAWILVRYEFPGRRLIDSLIDLPFALPTAVAGLTLSALFATNGWIGQWLAPVDIKVSYTFYGIVVAMFFTSLPFVVRSLQPVLEDLSPEFEEAAESLGANRWQIFRRVVWPHIFPAFVQGVGLSYVRCLGEFGAIIFIAGNMPYSTEVISLMVFTYIGEYNYVAAAAVALFILTVSLVLLLLLQIAQRFYLSPKLR